MLRWLTLLLLCAVAHADPKLTLELTVVNGAGRPIAEAMVWNHDHDLETDKNGVVRVPDLEEGDELSIAALGRAAAFIRVSSATPTRRVTLGPGTIASGTVVGPDGKPIAGATVTIEFDGEVLHLEHLTADAHGDWWTPGLGDGRFPVSASAPGFSDDARARVIETDGRQEVRGVIIRLAKVSAVSGVVVDAGGHPVAGAAVSVDHAVSGANAVTDAAGRFTIGNFGAGKHEVNATTPAGAAVQQIVELPGTASVRLVIVPGTLAGRVTDSRGRPIADARITARPKANAAFAGGDSDASGRFDLGGVAPGQYELTAEQSGVTSAVAVVGAGTRDATLVIPDGGAVIGRVMIDGVPATSFGLAVESGYPYPRPQQAADGRWRRDALTPGTYRVAIVARDCMPVTYTVTLRAGAVVNLGDIALAHGRVLTGRVVDELGHPVPHALVQINDDDRWVPEWPSDQLDGFVATTTDDTGTYTFTGLVPTWPVRIEASFEDRYSAHLALGPGDDHVDLALVATGELAGTVAQPSKDWQRNYVIVTATDTPAVFYRMLANGGTGKFHVDHLPAGDYSVAIDGRPAKRVTVTAHARATITIAK